LKLERIHHIDYVVRDLDHAVKRYHKIFGVAFQERERLENRGIEAARFRLGETWIILVQPIWSDSPVKRFLDVHGEGFFHIAYEVHNLDSTVAGLKENGIRMVNDVPRRGLEGWRLVDLEQEETLGVMTQLVSPI